MYNRQLLKLPTVLALYSCYIAYELKLSGTRTPLCSIILVYDNMIGTRVTIIDLFSFTPRGNPSVKKLYMDLDTFVLHFRRILEALCVEWRNSTPCFAALIERGNENIEYFIFPSGNQTYYLSLLQSHDCATTEFRLA